MTPQQLKESARKEFEKYSIYFISWEKFEKTKDYIVNSLITKAYEEGKREEKENSMKEQIRIFEELKPAISIIQVREAIEDKIQKLNNLTKKL